MKEEIKNLNTKSRLSIVFSLFTKFYRIAWSVEKVQKVNDKNKKRKNNAFIKMCSVW